MLKRKSLLHIQILIFLIPVCLFFPQIAQSQTNPEDSLVLRVLLDSIKITNKLNDWDKSIDLASRATDIAKKLNDNKKEAHAYHQIASAYFNKGFTLEALENYQKAYQIRLANNDKKAVAISLNSIGRTYMNMANYPMALSFFLKGLKVSEELNDSNSSALLLYNIGVIYFHRKEYERALNFLDSSASFAIPIGATNLIGNIHKTRGTVYNEMGNYSNALNEYSLALTIIKNTREHADYAAVLNNIGYLFYNQGDYELALKSHFESLEVKKKNNNQRGIATSYHSIAETYFAMGDIKNALHFANLAVLLAHRMSIKKLEETSYKLLSEIHSQQGNFKEAYFALANRFVLYDSINSETTAGKMLQLERNYEFEKKLQQQQIEQDTRESILVEESRRNKLARNGLIILILLVSTLVSISTFSYFRIRKDNQRLLQQKCEMEMQNEEMESQRDSLANLNIELQQKTYEILEQRDELEHQRDLVTMQKREITDSIIYAQRIQQAILPTKQTLSKLFPESLILYKPKNVVSGDFYWVSKIGKHRVIAVADCTGHGVPGGFMSMLGIAFLNDIVSKSRITTSSKVLELLREFIIESLHQSENPIESFDGMDMSFCTIHDDTLEMQFAGANSSAFISRKNPKEGEEPLILISGDRMPVSMHIRLDPFSNTKVQLAEGDMIYLFTDGFHDQFGGQEGRKYNFRRFRNLIEAVRELPVDKQYQIIEKTFSKWKGDHYQVDDVLVLGVRV